MIIINDVPLKCINEAAIHYHVPAPIIISILRTEGGKIGSASRNKNGSYDFGPMQINSSWLSTLKNYGYTQHDIQYDPCKNVAVGTWILALSIADGQTLWRGIGNYNSHTLYYNVQYQYKVKSTLSYLVNKLNKET